MSVNIRSTNTRASSIGRVAYFALQWQAKILLVLGLRERATAVFLGVLARLPDDVYSLNSLAYGALQTGNRVLALNYFEQVARLSPDNANSHFNQAFVCEELGRLDEAERGFRAAIGLNDKLDLAWYGLGLVLVRQGRLDDALVVLKRNTKLQPMSPFGWYQLARVHVDLKQPEEARSVIRHLKGFEPKVAAQLERETGLKVGES